MLSATLWRVGRRGKPSSSAEHSTLSCCEITCDGSCICISGQCNTGQRSGRWCTHMHVSCVPSSILYPPRQHRNAPNGDFFCAGGGIVGADVVRLTAGGCINATFWAGVLLWRSTRAGPLPLLTPPSTSAGGALSSGLGKVAAFSSWPGMDCERMLSSVGLSGVCAAENG